MTERLFDHANLMISTVSLQDAIERRKKAIAEHRAALASTTRGVGPHIQGKPPPVPSYGASRIQDVLQSTEQLSTVHATIALTGAVSRYKMAARASSPRGEQELTAVHYSLSAAEAQKADVVALEAHADTQRRDVVSRLFKLRPQQRRLLASSSPTKHVARLGAGPVPGGELTVPPRKGPAWTDSYPHLSTQAASYAEKKAARQRASAAAHASALAGGLAVVPSSVVSVQTYTELLQQHSPPPSAAGAFGVRKLNRPMSAPNLVRVAPSSRPGSAKPPTATVPSAGGGGGRPQSAKPTVLVAPATQVSPRQQQQQFNHFPRSEGAATSQPAIPAYAAPPPATAPSTSSAAIVPTHRKPPIAPPVEYARPTSASGCMNCGTDGRSSPGHFAHGNVRWRPAPTAPGAATMGQSASAAVLGTRPQTASAATVSTSGAAADLGGAVGNAIAAELEERAAIAHTEKLLEENERMRQEAKELMSEREEEEQEGRAYLAPAPSPASVRPSARPSKEPRSEGAPSLAPAEAAAGAPANAPSAAEAMLDSANMTETEKKAAKRHQLAAKARRVLKEFVRLRMQDATAFSVDKWSISGINFQKLAKVALEISKISSALRTTDFFSDLGERQLFMMASAGMRHKIDRYGVLYREGAAATCFYVLTGGAVLEQSLDPVWKEPELKPGKKREKGYRRDRRTLECDKRPGSTFTLFGMESVVGRPRTSTISVLGDGCEVLKFPASNLNIRRDGAAAIARKVFNSFLEGELAATTAFKGTLPRALKEAVTMLVLDEVEGGTTLYTEGNPGDKVFFVMHGSVKIYNKSKLVATLTAEQGQATTTEGGMPIFGHFALTERSPRQRKAVVAMDSKLLVLPLESWAAFTLAIPDIKGRLKKRVNADVG